jgi:hypothetical protein
VCSPCLGSRCPFDCRQAVAAEPRKAPSWVELDREREPTICLARLGSTSKSSAWHASGSSDLSQTIHAGLKHSLRSPLTDVPTCVICLQPATVLSRLVLQHALVDRKHCILSLCPEPVDPEHLHAAGRWGPHWPRDMVDIATSEWIKLRQRHRTSASSINGCFAGLAALQASAH